MLFAITFNIRVGWFLLYFFLLVFLCSMVSIRGRFGSYQTDIEPLIRLELGEQEISFKLRAKHHRRLVIPSRLTGTLDLSEDQFALSWTKSEDQRLLIVTAQIDEAIERGLHQPVAARFVSKDLFNLFRKTHSFPLVTFIMVMPKRLVAEGHEMMAILSQQKLLPLAATFIKSQDVKGLRDYREGDQLNQIDWKLSAKRDHLVVKEFESDPQDELIFLFYGNDGHYYEKMLALFYTMEMSESGQLGSPDFLMYDQPKESFELATELLYTGCQPHHMEKELVRGVRQVNLNKKRLIILTARYSRDIIGLGEELSEKNDVVVFYYSRQGQLQYEGF